MTNISRRSVARGAAWSVPAISLATSAPALAASPPPSCTDVYSCPGSPMTLQAGSSPSATVSANLSRRYPGGTTYDIALGQWNVMPVSYTHSCPGVPTTTLNPTGYYLNFGTWGGTPGDSDGTGPVSSLTNRAGTAYQGYMVSSTPVAASPQVGFAGLSVQSRVETNVPYTARTCQASQNLGKISMPFTITFLQGTTPVAKSCSYSLNMDFTNGTACSPTIGATYTITTP